MDFLPDNMVRKLKFHEQKLLRKVDFVNWEASNNLHEAKIMKRYHIQKREEYTLYNKLSREIRDIVRKIKDLDPKSPHRVEMSAAFLEKLYNIGLIPTKWNLELCDKVACIVISSWLSAQPGVEWLQVRL